MASLFVPYCGKRPAALRINGHRLLILSRDEDLIEDSLHLIGADNVRKIESGASEAEEEHCIGTLARRVKGGVVVAPDGSAVNDLIRNLEQELPWIH